MYVNWVQTADEKGCNAVKIERVKGEFKNDEQ